MDQDLDAIRDALASFKPDMKDSPGRLSFIDGLPFGLLIDFAHNPSQLEVLTRFAGRYDTKGRRICLMTVGGNRSEVHIKACGRAVAGHFDYYLCYERQDLLRGRIRGEIAGLLRQGMIDGGVPESKIEAGLDIWDAIDHAVERAAPGDFIVILATAWLSLVPAFRRAAAEKFPDWQQSEVPATDTSKDGRGAVRASR
jgi:cyanophycin synthetase